MTVALHPSQVEIMTIPTGTDNVLPAFYVDFFNEKAPVPFCRH